MLLTPPVKRMRSSVLFQAAQLDLDLSKGIRPTYPKPITPVGTRGKGQDTRVLGFILIGAYKCSTVIDICMPLDKVQSLCQGIQCRTV